MTGSARFDEAHWERNARNWCAWWHGELERPMVVIEAVARRPDLGGAWRDHITGFPMSVSPEAVMDHYAAQLDGMLWAGDAFPRWWPNFGPGIIAAFLGSPVEAPTGTTWFCPSGITSLAETELTYSPDNLWWERVASVTRAAVDRWGDRVVIGHTDLGGNLDILASLRGAQELLLERQFRARRIGQPSLDGVDAGVPDNDLAALVPGKRALHDVPQRIQQQHDRQQQHVVPREG